MLHFILGAVFKSFKNKANDKGLLYHIVLCLENLRKRGDYHPLY